jgi:hypothetical protein
MYFIKRDIYRVIQEEGHGHGGDNIGQRETQSLGIKAAGA